MLVLDCSSSLADDFVKAQTNAKDFINTLYHAVGGTVNPGEQEETIYSTTPKDLSLAIWKDGTRYYLTSEQYKTANLANCQVEGLTIIGGRESFILSLRDIQSGPIIPRTTAMKLYETILPSEDQGKIISAKWSDINNAIYSFGGYQLNSNVGYYTSSTMYAGGSYPYETVIMGSGGSLYNTSSSLYVRGAYPTDYSGPVLWHDTDDLKLSVIMNGKRIYLNQNEYSENLSNIESIEGVLVVAGGEKFIVLLNDAQSTGISDVSTAQQLYLDIMPYEKQGIIISARWTDINNAIYSFGGSVMVSNRSYYTSSTSSVSGENGKPYYWNPIIYGSGGRLDGSYSAPYIRGVITVQE